MAFTKVSVKPNTGKSPAGRVVASFAGVRMDGVPLERIVRYAYDWRYLIEGVPRWYADPWNIEAATGMVASDDQRRGMVRTLLEDSFHFSCHLEPRRQVVYRMTLGKRPQIVPTRAEVSEGFRLAGIDKNEHTPIWRAVDVSMAGLAVALTRYLAIPFLDETGTAGGFDFTCVGWTPYIYKPAYTEAGVPEAYGQASDYLSRVEEQLGLVLTKDHAVVDTLVIDKVEKPDAAKAK